MLDQITPVLLTFNEEVNIAATLSRLSWAKDVVVVDSGSTDGTLGILLQHPKVRVFHRTLDTMADQWRFAVQQTGIATPWILRLDADYRVPDELISELADLDPDAPVNAYRISFDYAVFSQMLRASLYPANTILLRQGQFTVENKGHTEIWLPAGPIGTLAGHVVHDDWKAADAWTTNQLRYMTQELMRLDGGAQGMANWLRRRPPLMPIAVFLYCLFGRGLIFNGKAGLFYALQRLVAEAILSLKILENALRQRSNASRNRADSI